MKAMPNAKYILGVPFARTSNWGNIIPFVKEGVSRIGMDRVYAFELGNEPNNYNPEHFRDSSYGVADYIEEWTNWTAGISNALGLDPNDAHYTGYTIMSYEEPHQRNDTLPVPEWTV